MSLGHALKYNRETGSLEWSEGYRYEDLTKEHQSIIDLLRDLVNDIEGFKYDYEVELGEEDTPLIKKLKDEIVIETSNKIKEYLESSIDEIQVSLADSEGEE